MRRRLRQYEFDRALPQLAEECRFARQSGSGKKLRAGRLAQGFLDACLHQAARCAMAIEPIDQESQPLLLDAAPGGLIEQRYLGLAPNPFRDIDHPVGPFVPAGERVGALHQWRELGRILRVLRIMVGCAPNPATDHPDFEKQYLHYGCSSLNIPEIVPADPVRALGAPRAATTATSSTACAI